MVRDRVGGPDDPRVRALLDEVRTWCASGGVPTAAQLAAAPVVGSDAAPWLYDAPHLLVVLPTPTDREGWQQADERLARTARLLRAVRERVGEVVGNSVPGAAVRTLAGALPVFVVSDQEAIATWQRAFGESQAYPVQADFLAVGPALALIAGGPAAGRWHRDLPSAGGRVQRNGDQILAHEAMHQLVAALRREAHGGDTAFPFWLDEGLAEYVGGIEANAATIDELPIDSITHGRIHLERVTTARALRRAGVRRWPLDELASPRDMAQLMLAGDERSPGRAPQEANRWFFDAWAFVHFLWYYDDGHYREGFRRYLGDTIGGGDGDAEALRRALGMSGVAESEQLSAELEFYSDELLRRIAGRRPGDPSSWYQPSTDPPTDVFDPDAEDRDYDE